MEYLKKLKQIVKINSTTKNKKGVDEVSLVMTSWLSKLGFIAKVYEKETLGNHMLYQTPKTDGKKILLLGHNDTVLEESVCSYKEDETWVYGSGVCDMKGGNVVAVEALMNVYEENGKIENIDFLLVSDEEMGSDDSKLITSEIAKDYDYCFVFEAAGENMELVDGRKGVGTFTIFIEGKASHAGNSYKEGVDANLEASYKLQELIKLTNLELGTTVNVGKITGGIGANTISPKSELLLEIRYKTNDEKNRLLKSLDDITKKSYVKNTKSTISGLIQRDVMEPNDKQLNLVKSLEKITKETIKTEQRGGVSDANIVASYGVATLDGFGPFGDGDHTVRERALKTSFVSRIKMMTSMILYHQKNKDF